MKKVQDALGRLNSYNTSMRIFGRLQRLYMMVAVLVAGSIPALAYAHVTWFATPGISVRPYTITDTPVLIIILIALLIIGIAYVLDRQVSTPMWLQKLMQHWAPSLLSLASIGFGIAFIVFSIQGFIFAPPVTVIDGVGVVLLIVQAIAGIMIALGLYERIGGLLILLLWIISVFHFGAAQMMDALEMVGFALYAMIIGRPRWKIVDTMLFQSFVHNIREYAVPVLRVATGVNLIILGFSEKIFAPSLTANFLTHYHWNFLATVGVTDYWFAFTAGMIEIVFGVLLVCGFVTRLTTIAFGIFLITTLVLLGPMELIGHLPHFSIAIVLLLFGAGSRLVVGQKISYKNLKSKRP